MRKPKPKPSKKHLPAKYVRHSELIIPKKIGRPIEWTPERIEDERIALEKWINNPKNYFFTAFLNQRKLGPEQIERFARDSQSFCETYARARRVQEERIVEAALTRKFDGNFAKFVLQNRAGWKEKSEVSGDGTNPLAIILDRIGNNAKDPLDYLDE